MADAPDKGKKDGGMKQLIMALVAVTVLGLGAGYGMGMFMAPAPQPAATKPDAKPAADAHGAPAAKDEKKAEGGHGAEAGHGEDAAATEEEPAEEPINIGELVATPFPPVVTNISNPQTVWIRIEGSVLSKKQTETKPDVLAMRAAQQILAYLRTTSLDELQGPNGLQNLTEDLNEIMVNFSNGDVRSVLINGLIVE